MENIKNLRGLLQKQPIPNNKQKFFIDSKISMNYAICELALNSFHNDQKLEVELKRIIGEHVFEFFFYNLISFICISNRIIPKAHLSSDSDISDIKDNLDDSQLSACYYNLAVVYYYNREYGKSLKIIEKIHDSFNELLDEKLSRQTTIMYTDLLILTNQVITN